MLVPVTDFTGREKQHMQGPLVGVAARSWGRGTRGRRDVPRAPATPTGRAGSRGAAGRRKPGSAAVPAVPSSGLPGRCPALARVADVAVVDAPVPGERPGHGVVLAIE